MEFINKNLKQVGIVNIILIVATIVLLFINFSSRTTIAKIDVIVCVIALIFGIFYAFNGYKKDAAKYYKAFMILVFVSALNSIITPLSFIITSQSADAVSGIILTICHLPIAVCIGFLSFGKDLGKDKSIKLAIAVLVLNAIKLLYIVITGGTLGITTLSACIANAILAIIIVVFVSAKYADKASRGAK